TTAVRVSRYETVFERDSLAVSFPPKAIERLDMATLVQIIVKAAPLTSLGGTCIQLEQEYSEGVPAACWQAGGLNATYSPWLIFPDDASSVFFRPTIWGKSVDSPEMGINSGCSLAQAMTIREAEVRMETIAAILDAMATDFNHPSWQLMEYLLETFHQLPLSSLDVFRLIGAQPTAAVSLLLRSQFSEDRLFEFARRLRDELGLVWELASIDIWRNAASKLYQYWVATLGEDDATASFPIILKARLDRLAGEHPPLQLMLDVLLLELTSHPSNALVEVQRVSQGDRLAFTQQLWRGHDSLAQNLLFRGHANDADWPERAFFQEAIAGFIEVAAKPLQKKLEPIFKEVFWLSTPNDFKVSVANIPVLCALWAVTGTSQEWWEKPERRLALRKIKAFDPIWFEQAFGKAVAACLALGILVPGEMNVGHTKRMPI
ncbi:MAG: STY4851/ECs_5259 family protein, partial [Candidatus Nitrotoga sp.]